MNKLSASLFFVILAGVAAAYWVDRTGGDVVASAPALTDVDSFDKLAPVDTRIAALEQAVSIERQARQLLQEEVMILGDEIQRLSSIEIMPEITIDDAVVAERMVTRRAERRNRFRRQNSGEGRAENLVESGFSPGEADWIIRRESELQMAAIQARYDAQREAGFSENRNAQNALRQELGDSAYERYLKANGGSTGVTVSMVIEGSPAVAAGLQVGDEIVNYDGRRMFSMSDLTSEILQGETGRNVIVDITRDGIPMQIVLPRGPIGITGGGRYSRQ